MEEWDILKVIQSRDINNNYHLHTVAIKTSKVYFECYCFTRKDIWWFSLIATITEEIYLCEQRQNVKVIESIYISGHGAFEN